MAQTRFTCTLTRADEPACQSYARVTIMDSGGCQPQLAGVRVMLSPRSMASLAPRWIGATPRASTNGSVRPLS